MLTFESLEKSILSGAIDTVIVAFPDLQGRPVGKRMTGKFFLSHVVEHGWEACDYLLGVDVDMEPLPGYNFANWDLGYGDVVASLDLSTITLIPWLEGSAMVLCDVADTAGVPVEVSPRQILRRQIERAEQRGFTIKMRHGTRVLSLQRVLRGSFCQGMAGSHPALRHDRGLPTSSNIER